MMDLAELGKMIANILGAVAIIAVIVFAAVAYLKQWGVAGKALTGSGFAAGLLIAFAARFMILPPTSLQDWIATAFMGLMAGFLATGAYKGVESATGKTEYLKIDGKGKDLQEYTARLDEYCEPTGDDLNVQG